VKEASVRPAATRGPATPLATKRHRERPAHPRAAGPAARARKARLAADCGDDHISPAEARSRRPTPHRPRLTIWDHTSTLLEPRQQRLCIYWLARLAFLSFCLCFDCSCDCSCVCPYVCVFVYARVLVLFNRFLIAFPHSWTPPSASLTAPNVSPILLE
jgi:hypothetical protein